MRYRLLFLFIILGLAACAQNKNFWDNVDVNSNRLEGKLTGAIYHLTAIGNSNYFMQSNWQEGTILLEDGDLYNNIRMRYLAFGDELVIFNDRLKNLFVADKQKINSFTINDNEKTLRFIKLYFGGISPGYKYFEEIYRGSKSLIAFHHIDETKTSIYKDEQGRLRDTRFDLFTNYYIYSKDGNFKRIYTSKKSFLTTFRENKKEVRRLLRRYGIYRFDKQNMHDAFKLLDDAGLI